MTLAERFLEACANFAGRTATVDEEGHKLTFAGLEGLARGAASVISKEPGRHVGILLPTSSSFVQAYFGTLLAGKVPVPLNFFLAPAEVAEVLKDAGAAAVITCRQFAGSVQGFPGKLLMAEELPDSAPGDYLPLSVSADDQAALIYTAGTTSAPKGVMLSHRNLLTNAGDAGRMFDVCPEDVFLCVLPHFHSFAITCLMLTPLLLGASVVHARRFSPAQALSLIEGNRVTAAIAVPSMWGLFLASDAVGRTETGSLRFVVAGGEKVPDETVLRFQEVFQTPLYQGYGLTEASPVVSANSARRNKLGSAGVCLESVSTMVTDPEGQQVGPGVEGEIQVRGPSICAGYYNRREETARAFAPGGWLKTGDLGFLDEDGFLTITGRKKFLIISSGMNISPYEVEAVVGLHPAVQEAVVVGQPDRVRGEVPVAFVVMKPGKTCTDAELRSFCLERLARYKVPRRFEFKDSLPRNVMGKVLRRALQAGS